jgi:hypothetical protein
MIKYNWEKIKRICDYDEINILWYFAIKSGVYKPKYLYKKLRRKIYLTKDYAYPPGYSYILNIKPLLINEVNATAKEIYQYINLASMRSYFDYKVRNIKTLPAIIAEEKIDNRLLRVENNKIHFMYE